MKSKFLQFFNEYKLGINWRVFVVVVIMANLAMVYNHSTLKQFIIVNGAIVLMNISAYFTWLSLIKRK